MPNPCLSLVFPAFNRLEFTKQSWAALMANTDWSLVSEFHVYDDGSTDGTYEWLTGPGTDLAPMVQSETEIFIHRTSFRSPMGLTLDWIKRSKAPILAKLDNDTIYPPGWLPIALDVMQRYPDLQMLGLECMRNPVRAQPREDMRGYLPARFVSGLGLYRASAFEQHGLPADNGYFGFEEWMEGQKIKCGWIQPSLPVFLLDRMPMEPWRSLSKEYTKKGWQRKWSLDLTYSQESPHYKHIQPIEAMWSWWKPIE